MCVCACVCIRTIEHKLNTSDKHLFDHFLNKIGKNVSIISTNKNRTGKKNDDSHRGASSRRLVLLLIPFSSVKTVSCSDDGMTMWKKTVNGLVKVKIYGGNHGSKFSRQNPKC